MTGQQQQGRNDAGAKVTVACKLPAGLMMRAHVKKTEREAVLGGGTREFDVWRWNGEEQRIFGTAAPQGKAPEAQIVAGYALTPNVSKDLWDNWFSGNRDGNLVKNKIVFAYERAEIVHGKAKECEHTVTGFEPIDPENPGKKVKGFDRIVKADVK